MAFDTNTLPLTFESWPEAAQVEFIAMQKRALEAEGTINSLREQFTDGILASKDPSKHNTLTWKAMVLQALNDVYKKAATTLDMQTVLDSVTKIVAELSNATSAYFCDWDEQTYKSSVVSEYISPRASQVETESDLGQIYQLNAVFAQNLLQEQGYWIRHYDDPDLEPYEREEFEQFGVKSILYVPMMADETLIGYIEIWETRQKQTYNQRQIDYVALIAEQVGGTFRNVQLHHALQESESRYRLLMNTMREGLVQVDANGIIEYANEPFGRLLGINALMLKGQNIADIWSHLKTEIKAHEAIITKADGEKIYVQISYSPIQNGKGQKTGAVYVYTDITERRLAERNALYLSIERERVQLLTQFVQDTSHEFYTPLSVIGTHAYLLQKKSSDSHLTHYIQTIQSQTETIRDLVKALVIMTTLDSVQSLELRPANLSEIVTTSVNQQMSAIDARSQRLVLETETDLAMIDCNTEKIAMAIRSVVDNAIRYTPPQGNITVRLYPQQNDYVLEVKDDGAGMSEDVSKSIFQRFYREDAARSTRGFGLGLAIAKRIVDLHHARIEVESAVGVGTIIRMIFPAVMPEPVM